MQVGIDYGRRKIGIAIADGPLAEPHSVIKVTGFEDALAKVTELAMRFAATEVVIGLSEGEMGKETQKFGSELQVKTHLPIVFQDETLSSWEAQQKSLEAGKKQKKRKEMEDAYAATVMLQNYIDESKL